MPIQVGSHLVQREVRVPIASYSVLKRRPIAGKVVMGRSKHQITVLGNGATFTVAVNIESVDGSEVLYAIE